MKTNEICNKIKSLNKKLDYPSMGDLFPETSPIYSSVGRDVVSLVEYISDAGVTIVTYANDINVNEFDMDYEELPIKIQKEILSALQYYDRNN